MTPIEKKATDLVLRGMVDVSHATFDSDGRLIEATGTVHSTHTYLVQIDPLTTHCSCEYGQNRTDATGHTHDLALRLQAQTDREELTHD